MIEVKPSAKIYAVPHFGKKKLATALGILKVGN